MIPEADAIKLVNEVVDLVAEAIKELGEVPSGHLYAALSGNLTLNVYQGIIARLVKRGDVKISNHLLTWIGK